MPPFHGDSTSPNTTGSATWRQPGFGTQNGSSMPLTPMRRRAVLGQGLAASVALLGGLTEPSKPKQELDVLVIGAGLAGLACAQRLIAAGQRVRVLEGRQRIGGRIWTEQRQGCTIDLGASWLHGSTNNPLRALASRELGLKLLPTDEASRVIIGRDGMRWGKGRKDQAEAWLADFVQQAEQRGDADAALSSLVPPRLTPDQHFLLLADVVHELGAELNTVAANAPLGDGQELIGGDAMVPAGLNQLVSHLAQGVDIRLGQVVREIHNTPQGVRVSTAAGDWVEARMLCCSVPLGVLKRGAIRFVPPLPAAKAEAIQRLGMGVLDKIVLMFPQRFWDAATWIGNDGPNHGLWPEWVDLTALIGRPALMGFNAATQAQLLARQPDRAIVASALGQLQRCHPQQPIPEPSDVLLTRWGEDPFAYGSYSYPAVGSTPAMREQLARRWHGLVFAGEAVNTAFPATLQGAYLSGLQAAQRLLPDYSWG